MMDRVRTLCQKGRLTEAVDVLLRKSVMEKKNKVHKALYARVLEACMQMNDLVQGKRVHDHLIQEGFVDIFLQNTIMDLYAKCGKVAFARQVFDEMPNPNVFSWNILIKGYARCGRLHDSRQVFEEMPLSSRNVVSWNTIITAHIQHGRAHEALDLFLQMLYMRHRVMPDAFTFSSVVHACANLMCLQKGRQLHSLVVKCGVVQRSFVGNVVIDMYVKCGSMVDAQRVFDTMGEEGLRDILSWTSIVSGYAKYNCMEDAQQLFDKMPERNEVSWNAMIAGYAQNGNGAEAFKLFQQMQKTYVRPTVPTFSSVLTACADLKVPETGELIHACVIKNGFEFNDSVGIALVIMYANVGLIENANRLFYKMPQHTVALQNAMITGFFQCNCIGDAQQLFDRMLDRDVISWNAMISGYAQNGNYGKALELFLEMQWTSIKPNQVTFVSVVDACASLANLHLTEQFHVQALKNGFESNVFLRNTLMDAYAKCGSIEDVRCFFDKMLYRDRISWNTVISGHAQNGQAMKALQLFDEMLVEGIEPDHITFISILSACSYAGLLKEGWRYLNSMTKDYHLIPKAEHYTCIIDMLGRAGHLKEAFDFINNLPFPADSSMWGALLNACRIHGNVELGERVAESLFELEPRNATRYVLLSNIYASAGRWDDVAKVRKVIEEGVLIKEPGCSWIEIKN